MKELISVLFWCYVCFFIPILITEGLDTEVRNVLMFGGGMAYIMGLEWDISRVCRKGSEGD